MLPDNLADRQFTQFIGPGGLLRMSFVWFRDALLAAAMLSLTNFGNWVKSTGGFLEAASSMGIPVNRVKIACFMLSSLLAGFAGTIQVLRLLAAALDRRGAGVAGGGVRGDRRHGADRRRRHGARRDRRRAADPGDRQRAGADQVDANWFKLAVGTLTIFAVVSNTWLRRTARRIKVTG